MADFPTGRPAADDVFSPEQPSASLISPQALIGVFGWAILLAIVGGYACARLIDMRQLGEIGTVSLWGLGAIGGVVGRKIVRQPSRLVGWMLVVATILAFLIAEAFWIQWNIKQADGSFWTAVTLLPTFFQKYFRSTFIGGIMTGFGAYSAYRQSV